MNDQLEENKKLRAEVDLMTRHAKEGWDLSHKRTRQWKEVEAERDRLQAEVAALNGIISMTVARVGGVVEGNPAGKHNFLQRIDELRRIEAENARYKAALEEIQSLHPQTRTHDICREALLPAEDGGTPK